MTFKNIIFDLDGTLIDSSDGVVAAVNYSLRQLGEPERDADEIKAFIGYPLSKMYPKFTNQSVKELYHHFQVMATDTIIQSTNSLPMVEETLHTLKEKGCRMAVASTKIRCHIDGIVDKLNWQKYFDCWSGGDEVKNVKPAPDIFLLTLDRLDCAKPDTIVVGDTENDVLAAKESSLKVVGVNSPYGKNDSLKKSKPDYLIDNIAELLNII